MSKIKLEMNLHVMWAKITKNMRNFEFEFEIFPLLKGGGLQLERGSQLGTIRYMVDAN